MKVLNLQAVTKIKEFGRRLAGSGKVMPDVAEFSAVNRIMTAKNKRECIDYARLYINSSDAVNGVHIPFLDKICAFMMGMGASPEKLRVVKNGSGKIVGGYMSNMVFPESFHISSMAVEKPGKASKVLPVIYKDMVNQVKKTNAKQVTCLVDPTCPSIIKLYKKLGFKVDGLADPLEFGYTGHRVLYHMYIPAGDFCKIM